MSMYSFHISGEPEIILRAGKRRGIFYRKFRVHVGGWYFGCRVFDTLEQMHAYGKRIEAMTGVVQCDPDTNAVFSSFEIVRGEGILPCHGTFLFTVESFNDPGIVAHECLHAAMYLQRNMYNNKDSRMGPDDLCPGATFLSDGSVPTYEEVACMTLAHLVKQMHAHL